MRINGTILSAGRAQGIILGDDGNRYTFTPSGWRDRKMGPTAGMRVEFEAHGSEAVGIDYVSASPPRTSPQSTGASLGSAKRLATRSGTSSGAPGASPTIPASTAGAASPDSRASLPQGTRVGSNAKRWALVAIGALLFVGLGGAAFVGYQWLGDSSRNSGPPSNRFTVDSPIGDGQEILVGRSTRFEILVRSVEQRRNPLDELLGLFREKTKRVRIAVSLPSANRRRDTISSDSERWDAMSAVLDVRVSSSGSNSSDISAYHPKSSGEGIQVDFDTVSTPDRMKRGVGLNLHITTRQAGEIPLIIQGWVCANPDVECWRQDALDSGKNLETRFEKRLSFNATADDGFIAYSQRETFGAALYKAAVQREDDIELGPRIRLTFNLDDDRNPEFSPDGRKIAYQSDRFDPDQNDDNDIFDIFMMNSDGTNVTRLTNASSSDFDPSWSPDGRRIAYASGSSEQSAIYVMNDNGSNVVPVTDDSARDESPTWSPDGRRIAFDRRVKSSVRICVTTFLDDRWSAPNCPVSGWSPSWSPTRDRIAFVADGSSGFLTDWDIFVMNPSGTSVYKLVDKTTYDDDPCWSPDGRHVVFRGMHSGLSWANDKHDIYVVSAGGSTVRELGTDGNAPSWSPPPNGVHSTNK